MILCVSFILLLNGIPPPPSPQSFPARDLWFFLPFGYLTTILIEAPILLLGLAKPISLRRRLWCGIWLTACTYPIIILVLPAILFDQSRSLYLAIAETFAPLGECFLFWLAFRSERALEGSDWIRSFGAIIVANLVSFGIGELLHSYYWFGLFGEHL